MKRKSFILIFTVTVMALVLLLSACNSSQGDETGAVYYTVTFDSNGGTPIKSKQAQAGKTVGMPNTPEKEGFIFDGWYYENREWSFEFSRVQEDMTLEAKWLSPETVFEHTPSGDGETTTITKVKVKTLNLTVPRAIGGYTVTAIGDGVFKNISEEEVTVITIPDTVTTVGNECFMNTDIVNIVVEGELLSIGEKAFYGCDGLREITFGEGIESITTEAFVSCTSLKIVTIPKSVKTIEENAFDSCSALQSIIIHSELEAIENMAFCDADIKVIYLYGNDDDAQELIDSKVDAGNDGILDASILIYSETEPEGDTEYNGFWYLDDNGNVRKWS